MKNKKKQKNNIEFLLIAITIFFYVLNNLFFKRITDGFFYYFFVGYFNDLICPLFFISYVNIMLSFINKRISKFFYIFLLCLICGLVWEFVAPFFKKDSVTDIYDLICYCLGGFLYWLIHKIVDKIWGV